MYIEIVQVQCKYLRIFLVNISLVLSQLSEAHAPDL